jgi:hypothetical protein
MRMVDSASGRPNSADKQKKVGALAREFATLFTGPKTHAALRWPYAEADSKLTCCRWCTRCERGIHIDTAVAECAHGPLLAALTAARYSEGGSGGTRSQVGHI